MPVVHHTVLSWYRKILFCILHLVDMLQNELVKVCKKGRKKGCAVLLLCVVLLHYASCNTNMYCVLQKEKWCRDSCVFPLMCFVQMQIHRRRKNARWYTVNSFTCLFSKTIRNASSSCLLHLLHQPCFPSVLFSVIQTVKKGRQM